ncbi:MAG: peptidoglycan recognition protein family protein [Woeseiaceae bacterium]
MIYLSRSSWGADKKLPRKGHLIGPLPRTEVFIHHTLVVDSDSTTNEWETEREVAARMRQLQRVRPDLGMDVPYNFVAFCMSHGELVLCEGRGLKRTGAHTKDRNRSAIGIAFQGNFQSGALPYKFDSQLLQLAAWLRDLRNKKGFDRLGYSRPRRSQVWGHRDAKAAKTLCPGQSLYDRLALIRFVDAEDETAMDKSTWKLVQRALQAQEPPLYARKAIDGKPGRNTNTALRAFEKRMSLTLRGVVGDANDPEAAIWPATRELLFATAAANLSS